MAASEGAAGRPCGAALSGLGRRDVGVRVEQKLDGWESLAESLHEEVKQIAAKSVFKKGAKSAYWVLIKHESADYPDYWEDLSKYRQQLESRMGEAWTLFSAAIDDAVSLNPEQP